jgi:dihydrofolate synthase / folylpolyglutamate synthase
MQRTLDQWLDYQQRVHPREIDLGLDRVRAVWQRMGAPQAPRNLIVGGTNGKGSTVAFLEAMLRAAGYRVGAYTSPHLLRYNERVRIDGEDVEDADFCAAFDRIEQARGDIVLTYFEFGTLAALDLFAQAGVDVAVLEVGLGGRLDATNIVDADAAIVTTVDLDHQSWLGPDRDAIGTEKGGIARKDRPLVVGEPDPPEGLLKMVHERGARLLRSRMHYHVRHGSRGWIWLHEDGTRLELPLPAVDANVQIYNAAAAIAALHSVEDILPCPPDALAAGVAGAKVPARLQVLPGRPEIVLDVAHNLQAARVLARWLDKHPVDGPVHAVFGALDDKDVPGILATLGERIAHWHLVGLETESPRGQPATTLSYALKPGASRDLHDDVATALHTAREARPARIVAFGSFFLVAALLRSMNTSQAPMP